MAKRGLLIVFEGCDRSGKSTQCKKLIDFLRKDGQKAELLRFPERSTTIGSMISNYLEKQCELDDRAVHLLFAANRWEYMAEMKKSLTEGTTIVVDRYAYSGVAFTAAKGYDLSWCKNPDRGLIAPDVVFYIDVSAKDVAKRGGFGEERYESNSFQQKVSEIYSRLKENSWKVIDGSRSIDEVHSEIRTITSDVIEQCSNNPLKSLWTDDEAN